MSETNYIKAIGIWYQRELNTIKKKDGTPLQPIFEAFTNSWEAINTLRTINTNEYNGSITISLYLTKKLFAKNDAGYDYQKIEITDNGVGFGDEEYNRFINLRQDNKNFSNKGTGRVQFLHTFDKTIINSVYRDSSSSTGFKRRDITLSKSDTFINQNSIIRLDFEGEVDATSPSTTLRFETILEKKETEYFTSLTAQQIKEDLIRHYLAGFCEKRNILPQIKIKTFIDNSLETELEIVSTDIPTPSKEQPIEIHYSKLNGNDIEVSANKEIFQFKAFLIPQKELNKNGLKLISKGEVARDIKLDNLLPTDQIDGNRYLFLLSGKYIDERDSDTRGDINILSRKEFKKREGEFEISLEEILLEDIEDRTNQLIVSLFEEIREKNKEKEKSIAELQKMFLLNPKTIKALQKKIHIEDTDETILRKVYEADAKIVAEKDAAIKQQKKDVEDLDPTKEDYQSQLIDKVNEFVKAIPLQNRAALTQYVARRKMVLELFDKILKKEIEKLKNGGRIDEDLMHNLIFKQSSANPEISDLWLVNEEFIYYKGFSETMLKQVKIGEEILFKKQFEEEVERYLNSLGEKRLTKRPDVLLFPDEGKCIIIEFKAPDTNVADHLRQIDTYASLIRNYTEDKFQITTFYGYLIGESVEDRDVRQIVGTWEHSYHLKYWYRPSVKITGFDNRADGNLYTEVIKYSTLLERATLRNKIFINKLDTNID